MTLRAVLLPVADTHIGQLILVAANYSVFISRNAKKEESVAPILSPQEEQKLDFDSSFNNPRGKANAGASQ